MGSVLKGLGILLQICFFAASAFAGVEPDMTAITQKAAKLQIPFIENRGQLKDPSVKFYANTFAGIVFVTEKGEIVYSLFGPDPATENKQGNYRGALRGTRRHSTAPKSETLPSKSAAQTVILKETLEGSREHCIEGSQKSSAEVNYFRGPENEWRTGISTWQEVSMGEVYPGIHLKLRAYGRNMEKLFTVYPEGSARDIRVKIEGANALRVNESGELEVGTERGAVRYTRPIAYQEINGKRVNVAVNYFLPDAGHSTMGSGQVYGFTLGHYDKTREVVIDPLLASTFLGGNRSDLGIAIKVDSLGNIYVAGVTRSSNFPTTSGAFDTSFNGGTTDFFISKIDASGNLLYSTFIGGSSDDFDSNEYDSLYVFGMTVDATGNVYMTGETFSSDFPTTSGAFDRTFNGNSDAFALKLNAAGNDLVYSTFLGGGGSDVPAGIEVDVAGHAYIAGTTDSLNFPTTSGTFRTSFNGGKTDWFAVKLNPSGSSLVYSTYIGGSTAPDCNSCYEDAGRISIDSAGNAYIVGGGEAADFPTTPGAYDRTHNGYYDIYLVKLNSTGTNLLAATYFGGTGGEFAEGLAIDSDGNVFISGDVESTNLPTTSGAFDRTYNGSGLQGFISKFDANLSTLLASTYFNGFTPAITAAPSGDVYVAGMAMSSKFPVTPGAYDISFNGGVPNGGVLIDKICSPNGCDAFVSKLDGDLTTLLASTFLGGSGNEVAFDIVLDSQGNVYVTGLTTSKDFPMVNAWDSSHNGSEDAFMAKLDENLSGLRLVQPGGGEIVPSGSAYEITWEPFPEAEKFKLLLSTDNKLTWKPITKAASGTFFPWSVPVSKKNKKAYIKILGYNASGKKVGTDLSDSYFIIETVSILSPNGGETLPSGVPVDITWRTTPTPKAPVASYSLYYSTNNGRAWSVIASEDGNSGSHSWTTPTVSTDKTKCKVRIVLKDAAGRVVGTDISDAVFTITP